MLVRISSQKNPLNSTLGENHFPKIVDKDMVNAPAQLTIIHKLVLGWLAIGIGIYIFGVFQYNWSLNHMAAMFIVIAIGTAVIARINSNKFVIQFFNGCRGLVYGALIIGMARSIVVVLENGNILDTIVQEMSKMMAPFTSVIGAIVMFIANFLFNIIVSSGSGQAVIVMPIMTPLADMMEISRQVAVQAYKMGDGFSNVITPISGVLMATLAIAGISWGKWLKFIMPLVIIWCVIGIVYLTIAVMIGWGPI